MNESHMRVAMRMKVIQRDGKCKARRKSEGHAECGQESEEVTMQLSLCMMEERQMMAFGAPATGARQERFAEFEPSLRPLLLPKRI
jgi:hypothetical protein